MQTYTKDRYGSRGIDIGEEPIPCERCIYYIMEGNVDRGVMKIDDIHHILSSYRGERTHSSDGYDIIGLCSHCHHDIHDNNDDDIREELLAIVKKTITIYGELKDKQKLWALVSNLYNIWKRQKS